MTDLNTHLRGLPSIDELLRSREGADLCSLYGSDIVTNHLRSALEKDRKTRLQKANNEAPFVIEEFLSSVRQSLDIFFTTDLRSVFNSFLPNPKSNSGFQSSSSGRTLKLTVGT